MKWYPLERRFLRSRILEDVTQSSQIHQLEDVLAAMETMDKQGIPITRNKAYTLLQGCKKENDLLGARRVLYLMVYSGLDSVTVLSDHLIRIFAYHGCFAEANQAFYGVVTPSVYTWSAIISANASIGGQVETAFNLCFQMHFSGIKNDKYVYAAALQACTMSKNSLHGRIMHCQIIESRLQSDIVITNLLIDMYVKCGNMEIAREVFENSTNKDLVSWGTIIAGYIQHGEPLLAISCFDISQQNGLELNDVIFLSILKACASIRSIEQGRKIHCDVIRYNQQFNSMLVSALIDMYIRCGSLMEACKTFDASLDVNVMSWNIMLSGYALKGEGYMALEHFAKMQEEGIKPDEVTFLSILRACGSIGAIEHGRSIHDHIMEYDLQPELRMGSALIDMYMKCGSLLEGQKVFNDMINYDVITWSSMIAGYCHHGEDHLALECFYEMLQGGVNPDEVTYLIVLKACTSAKVIQQGRLIHSQFIKSRIYFKSIWNVLTNMYVKCGSSEEAHIVFYSSPNRDVVSWNIMIAGYVQSGECFLSMESFDEMEKENIKPNVVSWGTLLAGYVQHSEGQLALDYFQKMKQEGIEPNEVTFSIVLRACASIGAVEQGRIIHKQAVDNKIQCSNLVGNVLIDMYAKCGSLEEAYSVFKTLLDQDLVSWNALIAGYAYYGDVHLSLECFEKMQQEGIDADEVSVTVILAACSCAGLVSEAYWYFKSMRAYLGIKPANSHYTCMINLLGRAGHLAEAEQLVLTNSGTDVKGWISLFNACRMHGDLKLSECCFQQILNLDPHCTVNYMIMSSIYSSAHFVK